MKCFNCGYPIDKSDPSNCKVCGSKYPIECPSCSIHNPKFAQYCLSCGYDLSKFNAINQPDTETRKNVGVLFADVSGFTKLSKMLDPEDVRELINDCFQYITRPVYELEGTIDKYIGDCVMVVFGNDYTHADDSFRTIKCAIEMMKRIDEFSQEKISKLNMKLDLSIGVNYGLVVSGNIGNLYDSDYTVLGDTVNIAQRLQSAAKPGEILASENVYLDTNELIHYGLKKSVLVKNIDKPVVTYQPISLRQETIFDSQYIVKREDDLDKMNNHFTSRKISHFNLITAPSGYGKTTLVRKFISNMDQSIRVVWVNSSHIFKEKPYYALSKIITSILNINPEDTSRIKRNRLISFSDYILSEYSESEIIKNYNFMALIMGLDRDNGYDDLINSMEYLDLQREIKNQASLFFEKISEKQNMYIVLDDVHMMDKESLETIIRFNNYKGFITFISQYIQDVFKSCQAVISLDSFSKQQTEFLIQIKLDDEVDQNLIDTIFDVTKGNPMHISELLLTIKKNDLYTKVDNKLSLKPDFDDIVTDSLESIITRNIQSLDSDSLQLLKIASVIGSEFNIYWIQKILGIEFDSSSFLSEAVKLSLIEFSSVKKSKNSIERIYSFIQNSTRLVIYNTLLKKDRRKIHEDIAILLENEYLDSLDQYYELIAYHYENAGNVNKAKEYYLKTANQFLRNYIFESSIKNFDKYLSYEKKESNKLVVMFSIGDIYINMSKYDLAFEILEQASKISKLDNDINHIDLMRIQIYKETTNFDEAIPLVESLSERLGKTSNLYGKLLQLKSAIYNMIGKQEVIEIAKQSEEILLKSHDYASLSETMSQAGIRYFINGEMQKGIDYLLKAYDYAEQSKNLNTLTKISINLGIFSHSSGEIDKSFAYLSNARDLATQVSNIKNYLSASINLGVFYLEKGLFSRALIIFEESIEKSESNNLLYQTCTALTNKADIKFELGLFEEAVEIYRESQNISNIIKLPIENAINELGIIKSNLAINKLENIEEQLKQTIEVFEESKEVGFIIDNYIYLAEFQLKSNNISDAFKTIELAIEKSKDINNILKEVQASRLKVLILDSLSRGKESLDLVRTILAKSYKLDSDYEVAKTALLASEIFDRYLEHDLSKEHLSIAAKFIKNIDSCLVKDKITAKGL